MKSLYVDSSVVVACLLEEATAPSLLKILSQSERAVSSYLLEAEVYSVAKREGVDNLLVEKLMQNIYLMTSDGSRKSEYQKIFHHGYVRGADACHLASALFLDPKADNLTFFTLDRNQGDMARKLGFTVTP